MEDWEARQRRALEKWVEVGGRRYKIRRPRDLQMREWFQKHGDNLELLSFDFVVDWEVTEADLLPGVGGDARVPFAPGAFREFISDRLRDMFDLSVAIFDDYKASAAARSEIPGKSATT